MDINTKKFKQINSFTGIRFLMILVIMCSHFEFFERTEFAGHYWRYLHNATMGVDYFFMLSGFGMMLSYIKNVNVSQINIRSSILFAIKKIKKIYPIYLFSLVISIPYLMIITYQNHSLTYIIGAIGAKFCLCLTLLQSATGIMTLSNGINSVGWFLSALFVIYLFSPLLLKAISQVNKRIVWAALIGFTGIYLFSLRMLSNIEKSTFFDNLVYGSPYSRIWIVCLGMVLGLIYIFFIEGKVINSKIALLLESIALILITCWFFARNGANENYTRIVDLFLLILFMLVFSLEQGKISALLGSKIFIKLGNITMFLFLLHYPIRLYIDAIFKNTGFGENTLGCVAEAFLIIILSIVVSIVLSKKTNKIPEKSRR